jgi:hypothetical protein
MPRYGLSYDVFYNQVKVGRLEVATAAPHYSPAEPNVTTAIELDWARWLPLSDIAGLVAWIASLTASEGDERRNAVSALHSAALDQLWQIEYDRSIDDRAMGGDLRVQFSGTADRHILVDLGPTRSGS